jgi:hypothetical protein
MMNQWAPVMGYVPIFHLLSRGWIGFVFHSKEETNKIISTHWFWDRHVLYAKPWHPLFDASVEALKILPIWIKLPNLSLQFGLDDKLNTI